MRDELIADIERLAESDLGAEEMEQLSQRIEELHDTKVLPTLSRYRNEPSVVNLQKLCVEIGDLCEQVYASTRSEEDRSIYRKMIKRITK